MEILKVSHSSRPQSVAGAIAAVVRERGTVELQAVGAAAVNQAIKAVAIARDYVASGGIDLVCTPGFVRIQVNEEEKTAMRFHLARRCPCRSLTCVLANQCRYGEEETETVEGVLLSPAIPNISDI